MMEFKFLVINGKTVNQTINENFYNVYDSIKDAYLLHKKGEAVNPNSYFLKFPDKPTARIIALPAYLGGKYNVSGIKWIGSYPDNVKKHFPRASAVLILNDYGTGYPFACIEASIISAMRTALSAVLATEYIAKSFRKCDWKFYNIFLYDQNIAEAERFKKNMEDNGHKNIVISSSLPLLVKNCDLIVFATTSLSPYFSDIALLKHNPIILNISLRDLSPEILLSSNNIVDDIDHVLNANTSPHLAFQKVENRNFINGTIADLIQEEISIDFCKPTIFSPMGMGILDLALGKTVYDYALKNKLAMEVNNFFFELER